MRYDPVFAQASLPPVGPHWKTDRPESEIPQPPQGPQFPPGLAKWIQFEPLLSDGRWRCRARNAVNGKRCMQRIAEGNHLCGIHHGVWAREQRAQRLNKHLE